MLEKLNYEKNKTVGLPDDMLNGQCCGPVSVMKYGLFDMSYNGCEMIAIYNAMRLLGHKAELKDICLEMYPKSAVLCGLFGSNPMRLDAYFKNHNISYYKITDSDAFWKELERSKYAIVSFWNHRRLFGSLHTVCVEYKDGKIHVYNRSSSKAYECEFDRPEEFTKKKLFIVGYCFRHI